MSIKELFKKKDLLGGQDWFITIDFRVCSSSVGSIIPYICCKALDGEYDIWHMSVIVVYHKAVGLCCSTAMVK